MTSQTIPERGERAREIFRAIVESYLASGTPVVTSNVSSLPEVAGDAAVLVDPYDPQAIADGIYRVLTDEELRRDLRRKGLARARQFSWEQSVRRVREIYGEVGA